MIIWGGDEREFKFYRFLMERNASCPGLESDLKNHDWSEWNAKRYDRLSRILTHQSADKFH